jgi:hypothetical protein
MLIDSIPNGDGAFTFICLSSLCAWTGWIFAGFKNAKNNADDLQSENVESKELMQARLQLLMSEFLAAYLEDNQAAMLELEARISRFITHASENNITLNTHVEYHANMGEDNAVHFSRTF